MKILVIFYSYTNHTRELAQDKAKAENADVCEVKEIKPSGKLKTYTLGSFAAMKQKKAAIEPITADLNQYDKLIIMAPIWAGMQAPAMNNILEMLPSGKEVEVILVSASGTSRAIENIRSTVESKGCKLVKCEDVKYAGGHS